VRVCASGLTRFRSHGDDKGHKEAMTKASDDEGQHKIGTSCLVVKVHEIYR
jgi:hypothetical protein